MRALPLSHTLKVATQCVQSVIGGNVRSVSFDATLYSSICARENELAPQLIRVPGSALVLLQSAPSSSSPDQRNVSRGKFEMCESKLFSKLAVHTMVFHKERSAVRKERFPVETFLFGHAKLIDLHVGVTLVDKLAIRDHL